MSGIVLAISWLTSVFWLVDMAMAFNTGFYRNGELRYRRGEIASHYLRGWFLPDMLMLIADWVSIAFTTTGTRSSLLSIVRACRVMKILRVTRMLRFVESVMSRILEFETRFAVQVVVVIFGICIVNHLLCCLWWIIGSSGPCDTGVRWTDVLRSQGEHRSIVSDYAITMQWTIATMTLGATTDVTAKTTLERCYNATLLIVAMLSGSSLVSFVSAQVMQLAALKQDRTRKLQSLRRFLLQEHVAQDLAGEIQRQAQDRLKRQEQIQEADVQALRILSTSLRMELVSATRLPYMVTHPLIRIWAQLDTGAVEYLCQEATRIEYLQSQDDLFMPGQPAHSAYLVIHGRLVYEQQPAWSMVDFLTRTEVLRDAWICEAALWSSWTHVGKVTAKSHSKLVSVTAAGLERVLSIKPIIANITKTYAKNFHHRVIQAIPPNAPWPTDLHVPNTDASDLFSTDIDVALLSLALEQGTAQLSAEDEEALRKELREGRCGLQLSEAGELSRVVMLVALRIARLDGRVLYEVGTWTKDEGVVVSCCLPGTRRFRGELLHEAVRRMLHESLAPLSERLQLEECECAAEQAPCTTHGLGTTYLEAVQRASYEGDEEEEGELFIARPPPGRCAGRPQLGGGVPLAEVYALPSRRGAGLRYYAWLATEEGERLGAPEASAALQAWLAALAPPREEEDFQM